MRAHNGNCIMYLPVATVEDLKEYVCSILNVQGEECTNFKLGYYERGHGTKEMANRGQ